MCGSTKKKAKEISSAARLGIDLGEKKSRSIVHLLAVYRKHI